MKVMNWAIKKGKVVFQYIDWEITVEKVYTI